MQLAGEAEPVSVAGGRALWWLRQSSAGKQLLGRPLGPDIQTLQKLSSAFMGKVK